jgi:hypothetical protein
MERDTCETKAQTGLLDTQALHLFYYAIFL